MNQAAFSQSAFNQQLKKYYTFYTGGFLAFINALRRRHASRHHHQHTGHNAGQAPHQNTLNVIVVSERSIPSISSRLSLI